jgi:hypothetical protein
MPNDPDFDIFGNDERGFLEQLKNELWNATGREKTRPRRDAIKSRDLCEVLV